MHSLMTASVRISRADGQISRFHKLASTCCVPDWIDKLGAYS